MIYLIAGTSHTGKTVLAQRLLEEKHWPYLSLDHLKMGLIRSGNTDLTVFDDDGEAFTADDEESELILLRNTAFDTVKDRIGPVVNSVSVDKKIVIYVSLL